MQKVITPITVESKENLLYGLYLDIETTGLSKERSILSMIGCLFTTPETCTLIQWFNDNAVSEEEILIDFYQFLQQYKETEKNPVLITFNGKSFDIPYLCTHFSYHNLPTTIFEQISSLDLYKKLVPFQKAFHLEHGRQKDWEKLLCQNREAPYSGKELIQIYKNYLKSKQVEKADAIFLHNKEDLLELFQLSILCSFPDTLEKDWSICDVSSHSPTTLMVNCEMPKSFPIPLRIEKDLTSVNFFNNQLVFVIPYIDGTMRHFYSDYQNYYYLPEEDYAVHKSVGCYVEASHRQKATATSCYIKKDGIFFLLPKSRRKNGLQISSSFYQDLPQYRPRYKSKEFYIELDDLMSNQNILCQYLKDIIKILLWDKN